MHHKRWNEANHPRPHDDMAAGTSVLESYLNHTWQNNWASWRRSGGPCNGRKKTDLSLDIRHCWPAGVITAFSVWIPCCAAPISKTETTLCYRYLFANAQIKSERIRRPCQKSVSGASHQTHYAPLKNPWMGQATKSTTRVSKSVDGASHRTHYTFPAPTGVYGWVTSSTLSSSSCWKSIQWESTISTYRYI